MGFDGRRGLWRVVVGIAERPLVPLPHRPLHLCRRLDWKRNRVEFHIHQTSISRLSWRPSPTCPRNYLSKSRVACNWTRTRCRFTYFPRILSEFFCSAARIRISLERAWCLLLRRRRRRAAEETRKSKGIDDYPSASSRTTFFAIRF